MNIKHTLVIGLLARTCVSGFAADAPADNYKETIQAAMARYGVSSNILRRRSALKDTPPTGSEGFPIDLPGKPGIRVVLDCDYWALSAAGKGNESITYMLNPKDEQSALVISVGESKGVMSDAELAKALGFTEITRHSGAIANEKIVWRSWATEEHLFSDSSVLLAAAGQEAKKYLVHLHITANTPERRKALEDHLESLKLSFLANTIGPKARGQNGPTGSDSSRRSP